MYIVNLHVHVHFVVFRTYGEYPKIESMKNIPDLQYILCTFTCNGEAKVKIALAIVHNNLRHDIYFLDTEIFLFLFSQYVLPVKRAAFMTLCLCISSVRKADNRKEMCSKFISGWSDQSSQ